MSIRIDETSINNLLNIKNQSQKTLAQNLDDVAKKSAIQDTAEISGKTPDPWKIPIENARQGITIDKTAKAGLKDIEGLLSDVRRLARQSSETDPSQQAKRDKFAQQVQADLAEIDNIASHTFVNGQQLLNATTGISVNVGPYGSSSDQISFKVVGATVSLLGLVSSSIVSAVANGGSFAMSQASKVEDAMSFALGQITALGEVRSQLLDFISQHHGQ